MFAFSRRIVVLNVLVLMCLSASQRLHKITIRSGRSCADASIRHSNKTDPPRKFLVSDHSASAHLVHPPAVR
jgi:hypothetical protein